MKSFSKKITDKYEVIASEVVESIHSEGYLLRHKKSGAHIILMANDDENKVFSIGFRTPPKNSTGVAHILEHSVLCGSEQFPLKDPFIELAKGSLNTFLNAMTYPDKTIYPVASCNLVDFQNLMHVYMDAVLKPNIYKEERIFMQEGWHYDLESLEGELSINGVVYNEMKGAFSSPDQVVSREVFNSLFPDTTYGMESGGDPQVIPELSYEEFLDFHRTFYHPVNSYIYLYGDMDMEERLQWMDETYLDSYSVIEMDSEIPLQKSFNEPLYRTIPYAISEEESDQNATYLTYNTVIGENLDPLQYIAFEILDYVLCSAPGAPVQRALMEANIGKEIYGSFENNIKQSFFGITAKGANFEDQEKFVEIILRVLKEQVEKGINKEALIGALNHYEFKQREADFGGYPKGLLYLIQSMDSSLYDISKPFLHVDALKTFKELRMLIEKGYFETLILEKILENKHTSIVAFIPDKSIQKQRDEKFRKEMAAYKDSLSKEELENIIQRKIKLTEFQEMEDTKEVIESIPLLARQDIKREAEEFHNEIQKIDGITHLHHPIETNGIQYTKVLFEIKNMSNELLPYVRLLKDLYTNVDTNHYSYNELSNQINKSTGGISFSVSTYKDSKNLPAYQLIFQAKVKTLADQTKTGLELLNEVMFESQFSDHKRILEVISEQKSKEQARMMFSGDQVAADCAMSYFSETAKISEIMQGITYYRFLEYLEESFDDKIDVILANLERVKNAIYREENLMLDTTIHTYDESLLKEYVGILKNNLSVLDPEPETWSFELKNENVGYQNSAQIQYVARAGDYRKVGLEYTGALEVLRVIMGYDYLWNNVRVKGGAYGCRISFTKSGECMMSSYRDPNLEKTVQVYEKAPAYIRSFKGDERTITKYVIGAMSNVDRPLTPQAKGTRSLSAYLSNITLADVQKQRDEILDITLEDIQSLAKYIEALLDQDAFCVVGNADKIKENENLFGHIEPLFH